MSRKGIFDLNVNSNMDVYYDQMIQDRQQEITDLLKQFETFSANSRQHKTKPGIGKTTKTAISFHH